jgi:hypothetical protein
MFGPFVLILTTFVGVETWRSRHDSRMNWALGMQVVAVLFLVLVGSMFVLTFLGLQIPQLSGPASNFIAQNGGLGSVLPTVMQRRVTHGLLTVSLLAGIGLVVGRLFPRPPHQPDQSPRAVTYPAATGFALLLVGMGLVLSLVPEFVYLRDNFGTRINTIFKFYYQTWVVFSLAAAYAVYTILADFRLPRPTPGIQRAFGVLLVVSIAAGMVYPILGIHNRMFIENGRMFADNSPPLTLDGGQTLISANDYGAIMCLNQAETGADATVAEAVGPAYNSGYGRVGALTGIPIVLGWENHERQWRGPTYGEVAGTRAEDIRELYTDLRWDVAQRIIDQYSIDYVLFGDSERASYGTLGEEKFIDNLAVVCEQGSTRIYRVGSQAVAEANLR